MITKSGPSSPRLPVLRWATPSKPGGICAVLQAAAMLEGFEGPLFLQGDHIQLKSKPVHEGGPAAEKEISTHRKVIQDLLAAGLGQSIWICLLLSEGPKENLSFEEQQAENAKLTAEKIADVRGAGKKAWNSLDSLIGGETGEVGKINTRKEDLEAYAEGIIANMKRLGIDPALGIRKIAVNDGNLPRRHPAPDGSVADVA